MIGESIGQYYITDKINEGGMGVVYRAMDTRLNREVAIKTVPAKLRKDTKAVARLKREAQFAAKVDHPFVCRVFDFLTAGDGAPVMVMEMIKGEPLSVARKQSEEARLRIASDVAEAIEAVHAVQVIHSDLKPSNILVTPSGRVRLMDFGLASIFELQPTLKLLPLGEITEKSLKQTGGTRGYQSPEQIQGVPLDHRSDIFVFGVILAELLTGRDPFRRATPVESANAALRETPDLKGMAPDLSALTGRLLGKAPGSRYQSMGAVRTDLFRARYARFLTKTIGVDA